MKIVHCIFSFNIGGSESMLVDILNEQVKSHDVYLVIVNDSYTTSLIETISNKVKLFYIGRKHNIFSAFYFLKLNLILFRINPDIIHVHNSSLPAVILKSASRALFLTVHALHVPLVHARRNVNIIAISDSVKDDIVSRERVHVEVIENGIKIQAISKRELCLFDRTKSFRIVQVARLDANKKGQDILIKAIAILKERGINNISVDLIGAGESEQNLKELAGNMQVLEQVHFLGSQNRSSIYSHLKNYDLMCHPSRYEGFGLAVAEGMAAMLPVLVPDADGPFEVVNHGKYGSVFKIGDEFDCADKIAEIYNNYDKALSIVPKAYEYVKRKYSIEKMVTEYLNLYQASIIGKDQQ